MQKRWSGHKKTCLDRNGKESGLAMHFEKVHHNDLKSLAVTIIDKTENESRLKDCEDWWILNLGTLHSEYGLNLRDEVKRKSRIPQFNKR